MRSELETYREVVCLDFEFMANPGEHQVPVCLVAHELKSGRRFRLWQDELRGLPVPPYATGDDVLFVAYFASAELGCYLTLSWPLPEHVLDLYCEFRVLTNGHTLPRGSGLLGALAYHGLPTIEALEKEEMRALALRGGPWTEDEKQALLAYCETDVAQLRSLLDRMLPGISLPHALLRGEYMKASARMEFNGIPVDVPTLELLKERWDSITDHLIRGIDQQYGVYDGRSFRVQRFALWLQRQGIPWPRLDSGALDLKQETFRDMAQSYPQVGPLKELRTTLGQLRLRDLAVGADGRNRCLLSPFKAKTSRNLPSSSQYIFGPSVWIRSLIKPEPEQAIAYIDWSQQEFGIAAVLSQDSRMLAAYTSGDPYTTFAVQAGALASGTRKEDAPEVREQFKACALAVQYGMGALSLANRINQRGDRAKELLNLHRRTYRKFWRWSDGTVDYATLKGSLWTTFDWRISMNGNTANIRSIRNWPMQSNGAEMLRLACVLALRSGVKVCGPIHDAILIEAPASEVEDHVQVARQAMARASAHVLDGFELRTDHRVTCHPDRYSDPRGEVMWQTIQTILAEVKDAPETSESRQLDLWKV